MKPKKTNTDAILAAAILGALATPDEETTAKDTRKEAKAFGLKAREIFLGIKDAGFDDNQAMELTIAVITKQ